jgi:polyisoprenoid-binding protein YceI
MFLTQLSTPGIFLISFFAGQLCALSQNNTGIYSVKSSTTYFHSNAKFELIKAESSKLKGAIDAGKRTFAFSVDVNTFEGFNSPLQKEHFNENYMETERFPTATFTGRIVEDDDFTKDGTYNVRAKGKFSIHGVEQERIIQGDLVVKNGVIKLRSRLTVILAEHDIKIPRIVHEKLASEIVVEINAEFTKK